MFAHSKCPHCESTTFKTVVQEPTGSKFKLTFIQCSGCDAPIGVIDFMNIGAMIEDQDEVVAKQDKVIAKQGHQLDRIEAALDVLAQAVRKLMADR